MLPFSSLEAARDRFVRAAESTGPCSYEDWKELRNAVEEAAGRHAKIGDFRGGAVVVGLDWFKHPIVSVVVEGGHLLNPQALQSLADVLKNQPAGSMIEVTGDLGSPADGLEAVLDQQRCVVGWKGCRADDCLRRVTEISGHLKSASAAPSSERRWWDIWKK